MLFSKQQVVSEYICRRLYRYFVYYDIDASVDVFKLGAGYWIKVYKKVENEKVVSFADKMIIKSIADMVSRNMLPSAAQAKRLIKIYNAAEDAGIVFE